jgi:hypothetical protein
MEQAKQFILENKVEELTTLLSQENEALVWNEVLQPGGEMFVEFRRAEVQKIYQEIKGLVKYAVNMKREECLKTIVKQFRDRIADFVEDTINTILSNNIDAHFVTFLKEMLTPNDVLDHMITMNVITMLLTREPLLSGIDGLEVLFQYIPQHQQEFYAIIAIRMIDTSALLHYLQRLDEIFSRYVDHAIFERHLLWLTHRRVVYLSGHDHDELILDFIKKTPQYAWIDKGEK